MRGNTKGAAYDDPSVRSLKPQARGWTNDRRTRGRFQCDNDQRRGGFRDPLRRSISGRRAGSGVNSSLVARTWAGLPGAEGSPRPAPSAPWRPAPAV